MPMEALISLLRNPSPPIGMLRPATNRHHDVYRVHHTVFWPVTQKPLDELDIFAKKETKIFQLPIDTLVPRMPSEKYIENQAQKVAN